MWVGNTVCYCEVLLTNNGEVSIYTLSMLFAALCFYQLDLPSLSRLTNFAYLLLYATIDTSEQGERGKRARKASAESELESGLQAVDDLLQT